MKSTQPIITDTNRTRDRFAAVVTTGLLILVTSVITTTADARSKKLIDVKLMPNTKQTWIAKRMNMNGVPTSIRQIENTQPLQRVIEHYKQSWSDQSEVIERRQDEWQILLTKMKDNFISLHLKSKGHGTEGMLMVSGDPQHYIDSAQTRLPLSPAFKILSRQEHMDSDGDAETITMSSTDGVAMVRSSLLSTLSADGWKTVYDKPATHIGTAHSLRLSRSRDHIKVFIGADPEWSEDTLILLTWQKKRT